MEDILSLCQRSPGGAVTRRLPNCFSTVRADVQLQEDVSRF